MRSAWTMRRPAVSVPVVATATTLIVWPTLRTRGKKSAKVFSSAAAPIAIWIRSVVVGTESISDTVMASATGTVIDLAMTQLLGLGMGLVTDTDTDMDMDMDI